MHSLFINNNSKLSHTYLTDLDGSVDRNWRQDVSNQTEYYTEKQQEKTGKNDPEKNLVAFL